MFFIYGYEVLQMMFVLGEFWMVVLLEVVICCCFGEEVWFYICLVENLSVVQLVVFLEKKGKFIVREEGFIIIENKIC